MKSYWLRGESAEKMAKENAISRRAQDEIALMAHQRASAATLDGRFAEQVVPVFPPPGYDRSVLVDNGVRHDSSLESLGRSAPLGEVDFDKLNVNGGSIAIGHPFGATGARVTLQLLFELRRRGLELGLATVCAAGGVGFAMVVERS